MLARAQRRNLVAQKRRARSAIEDRASLAARMEACSASGASGFWFFLRWRFRLLVLPSLALQASGSCFAGGSDFWFFLRWRFRLQILPSLAVQASSLREFRSGSSRPGSRSSRRARVLCGSDVERLRSPSIPTGRKSRCISNRQPWRAHRHRESALLSLLRGEIPAE